MKHLSLFPRTSFARVPIYRASQGSWRMRELKGGAARSEALEAREPFAECMQSSFWVLPVLALASLLSLASTLSAA